MGRNNTIPPDMNETPEGRNLYLSRLVETLPWNAKDVRTIRRTDNSWIIDVEPKDIKPVPVERSGRTEEKRNKALASALNSVALKGEKVRAIRRTNTGWELDLI